MQFVLLAVLSLAAWSSATVVVESLVGYHERVAIPMASKIKAAEEAIIANHNPNSRIVGGVVSKPNSHPYLGGLLISYVNNPGVGVCASVLVSRNRLLTAAHCWFDARVQASRFVVVLGSNYLFSGGQRIATSTVATYPGWNPTVNSHNNLAIIYLPNPISLTDSVYPIALATNPNETFVGAWATAAGYGWTSDAQTNVPVLSVINEVDVQVITVEACRRVFSRALPNTICTNETGGVGICKGDGGGPLVVTHNSQRVLIGVGSFRAANGCELGLPSGFVRITSFVDFIAQHL